MRRLILSTVLAFCLVPALAFADVTYEEESRMGGLMKIATFGKSMKSKTQVSGSFMRTDTGDQATIVDLDAEKIYTLDTKKKTYSVTTFEELRQKMASAMAQSKGDEGQSGGGSDVKASAEVRVSETGRSETIGGYACEQYLMEMDLELSSEKEQQSGTISTVMEMWLSKDVPGVDEIQAFHAAMAQKIGTTEVARQLFGGQGGSDQSAVFSTSMGKMAEEMKKLDGFPMRSVMYLGDPEAAKKEARGEKSEGGGLGGMLKKMTPLGAGGENAEQGGVIMKMTTETKKIETKSIDRKVFAVPENYKLVEVSY